MKPIPEFIWTLIKGDSLCVEYWFSSLKLEKEINTLLKDVKWKFVSHSIKERDSFGPVTSLLILQDDLGNSFEGLI